MTNYVFRFARTDRRTFKSLNLSHCEIKPLGPRLALGLGDHSSIEVDAVATNTVKFHELEKIGKKSEVSDECCVHFRL